MDHKVNPLATAVQAGLHTHAMKLQERAAAEVRYTLIVKGIHDAMRPYLDQLLALPTDEHPRDATTHQCVADVWLNVQDIQEGGYTCSRERAEQLILVDSGVRLRVGFDDSDEYCIVAPHPAHGYATDKVLVRQGSRYGAPRDCDALFSPLHGLHDAVAELLEQAASKINYAELAAREAA